MSGFLDMLINAPFKYSSNLVFQVLMRSISKSSKLSLLLSYSGTNSNNFMCRVVFFGLWVCWGFLFVFCVFWFCWGFLKDVAFWRGRMFSSRIVLCY